MKKLMLILPLVLLGFMSIAQKNNEIRLLMRADDIGSSHAANVACIQSYKEGIVKSVEIMVPCAWFEEAVTMLNENPGLDVGVHLVLTSEWENVKWRPLTCAPSITDANGNFFPMVWKNENFAPNTSIIEAKWDIAEIERELRAQIELAKKRIPQVSHLSSHMGFTGLDPKLRELYTKLAKEYNLNIEPQDYKVSGLKGFKKGETIDEQIDNFIAAINDLQPGTYMFVEHPGLDTPEMQAIGHVGYYNVAKDRQFVTSMFTSDKVKKAVQAKGIKLIGYNDLVK